MKYKKVAKKKNLSPIEHKKFFTEEELKNEIWKDVVGYEGLYQVSNLGRVKSLERVAYINRGRGGKGPRQTRPIKEKILFVRYGTNGRLGVQLSKNNETKLFYIHRLALSTFAGVQEGRPFCCHIDGDKNNNKIINLKWGTRLENEKDKIKHGTLSRGERCGTHKLMNEDVYRILYLYETEGYSQRSLAKMYNLEPSTIHSVVHKKSWRHLWNMAPE